ncbi:3-oxoacyl-ACP synthase [Parapedobacter sp. DT-150]|uniref:3-oxoacyl-ACP synthase n=1 Tax=Parapedobacter sp. DT-150 TaxID=3396162 RepID=UPI003F1CD2FB
MDNEYSTIKAALLAACKQYVAQRLANAQQAIASASDAAADDTKSSAGDKFETTREMMQQEIGRHQQLLAEAQRMAQVLAALNARPQTGPAKLGSLVETSRGTFFLAISAGRLDIGGQAFWAVSTASPMGHQLIGVEAGDHVVFNNLEYVIHQVV